MQVTKQQDYAETMDIDTENPLTESGQPALDDRTKDFPESYKGIADRLYDRYELDKALKYYSKSLTIRLSTSGENHTDTADTLYNKGVVHKSQNDPITATEYLNRALVIYCNKFGEGHEEVRATRRIIKSIEMSCVQ